MEANDKHGGDLIGLALLVILGAAVGCSDGERRADGSGTGGGSLAGSNVLITLIDACAADHVSAYGYERATTPFLDRFAAEAVVFDDVTAAAPYTLASVASLMTGEIVDVHDVTEAGDVLPEDLELLAEGFERAGYRTFGLSTNMRVHARFGFDRGFEELALVRPNVDDGRDHVVPPKVLAHLRRGLDGKDERPFFAYYHFMPPHAPYVPAAEHRDVFAGHLPDASAGSLDALKPLTAGAVRAAPELQRAIVDLYDSMVHYTDAVLAEIDAALEKRELEESTLWVILSDHGEAFGQHGVFQHSGTVYEEMLRVPLLVRLPGGLHGGRRVAAAVGLVDLHPTLVELFDLPIALPSTSTSLAPLLAEAPPERFERRLPLLSRTAPGGPHRSLRRGRWKLIHRAGEKRYELYDLEADPRERRDLARQRPDQLDVLRQELDAWVREARRLRKHAGRVELDPELLEDLGGFGYLGDD